MNLDTLIEILNDYRQEHGGDVEVRLMTQQNWPFENHICGITSGQEMNDAGEDDDDQDVADEYIVYIVEGGQICYGSKRAWESARAEDSGGGLRGTHHFFGWVVDFHFSF